MFKVGDKVIFQNEGFFVVDKIAETPAEGQAEPTVTLIPSKKRKDNLVIQVLRSVCVPYRVRFPLTETELDKVLENFASTDPPDLTKYAQAEPFFDKGYPIGDPNVQVQILRDLGTKEEAERSTQERRLWKEAYRGLLFEIATARKTSRVNAKRALDARLGLA